MNRVAGIDEMGAGGMFKTISPVDKTVICEVAHGTVEDIDKAASAARNTFAQWRDMPALNAGKFNPHR